MHWAFKLTALTTVAVLAGLALNADGRYAPDRDEAVVPTRSQSEPLITLEQRARPTASIGAVPTAEQPVTDPKPQAALAPVSPTAPTTPKQDALEIAGAERLSIKFQGYAELSGDYRIGSDQVISIPVVGRISVSGMSPSDLESAIAERMSKVTGRQAYITVEVMEYHAVFVAGYVMRPGSFPWRPGMTVLHALALAGGTFRAITENGSLVGDDAELERLQKAIANQKRNLAMLARLQAERRGAATVETPAKLIELVGKTDAEQLMQEQASALIGRRAGLEAKHAAIARALEMTKKELTGLSEQAQRLQGILAARKNYKEKVDSLQTKGFVAEHRSLEEYSRVADLEERSTIVAVATARVQATIASLERDRINLDHERSAEIHTEISKLERDIAQLDIEIDAARQRYRKLTGQNPPSSVLISAQSKKSQIKYEVARNSGQGTTSISSDDRMLLRPGDILVVNIE